MTQRGIHCTPALCPAVFFLAAALAAPASGASISGPFTFRIDSGSIAASAVISGTSLSIDAVLTNGYFLPTDIFTIGFELAPSAEPVDYSVTETITNDDVFPFTWLLVNVGCGPTQYLSCDTRDPSMLLDFSTPPSAGPTMAFPEESLSAVTVSWGLPLPGIPYGGSETFTFHVETCANCSGLWSFTEAYDVYTAPEPGTITLALVGLGCLAAVCFRR